jgi:hypothetical protein
MTMRPSRSIPLAVALLIAAPAMAQDKAAKEGAATPPAAGTDAGTTELNRQSADAAREQNAANAAGQQQYTQSVHDYEAERARTAAARSRYEQELEANRQARAEYAAADARWQADVAACNAGDRSRCAPTPR